MQPATVSLAEAKQLVAYIEQAQHAEANALIAAFSMQQSAEIFTEVGKLTRQLHDSLNNFQIDANIEKLVNDGIPDAESRLTYVLAETEKAANTTMDAIEQSMPLTESISTRINAILPEWNNLMAAEVGRSELTSLCTKIDGLLIDTAKDTQTVNRLLTDVLLAQGYQDLTGQVISRVIELVKEVQSSLVHLLTVFGEPVGEAKSVSNAKTRQLDHEQQKVKAEGPAIDAAQRDDVVNGQDDVDDLLSSLGF